MWEDTFCQNLDLSELFLCEYVLGGFLVLFSTPRVSVSQSGFPETCQTM